MTKTEREERKRAIRKFDLMCSTPIGVSREDEDGHARRLGMRPLRPPPVAPPSERVVPASRLALIQDQRAGVVDTYRDSRASPERIVRRARERAGEASEEA